MYPVPPPIAYTGVSTLVTGLLVMTGVASILVGLVLLRARTVALDKDTKR